MITSALPSPFFALCASVLHYHISVPQSPDGVRIIFHLLCVFWHTHTEDFELYHSEMFHYRQARAGFVVEFWSGFFSSSYSILSFFFCPCYAANPAIEMSDIPSAEMFCFPKIHYLASVK